MLYIFILIGLIFVLLLTNNPLLPYVTVNNLQRGGSSLPSGLDVPFSNTEKDQPYSGNTISWTGKPNYPDPVRREHPSYLDMSVPTNNVTFWGHGLPLVYETKSAYPDPSKYKEYDSDLELRDKTLSGKNLICSPDCCPSPYSCDRGCVCYSRDVKCFRYDGKWGKQ